MRRTALGVLCVLSMLMIGMTLADPFEGTKWKIKVSPDEEARNAGGKDFEEVLSFKGAMFSAASFEKRGFKPVQYEDDTRRFGPANFKAEPESEKEGKAKWTGMVTATSIKGELVWTKADGTTLNFTYTGEKVQ